MIARLLLCALLAGTVGIANAQNQPATTQQQPAARQLTPEQRAAIRKRNQAIVDYANQIVRQVDNGQYTQVWDGMSEVGKQAVARDQFARTVEQQRKPLGPVTSRRLAALYLSTSDGSKTLPAGTYLNVRYLTRFAAGAQPKNELVSFHLDGDHKWRLSGYICQDPPARTAQAVPKR
jgi:hypothetical protein